MPLDAPTEWPRIDRGGHLRNAKGEALIVPPGGGRHRRSIGGSGLDAFYVYSGPGGYAEQGSHVHTITEYADAGKPVDALIEAGEAVGTPGNVTRHCYDSYLEFVASLGWRTALTECIVVNDDYSVPIASNIDKIMWTPSGRHVVVDVKSANSFDHRGYAMQLAAYVGSSLYDPLTGERTPLPQPLETSVAYIMSYTVRVDRVWKLVKVDVPVGLSLLDEFDRLRKDDRHKSAFEIVDADTRPTLQTAQSSTHATIDAPKLPTTLDGLRALVGQWEPDAIKEFNEGLTAAGIPKGHPSRDDYQFMANAIERYTFGDVTVPASAPRIAVQRPHRAALPDATEGPEIGAEMADLVKARYDRLDPAGRSWIAEIGRGAQHAGTPFHMKEQRTVRRFEITRGLVHLAAGGFDNDDALRACLVPAIGAELADSMTFTHGQLVGCLGHDSAAVFAEHAVSLAEGEASMRFLDTGRCRIERKAAA